MNYKIPRQLVADVAHNAGVTQDQARQVMLKLFEQLQNIDETPVRIHGFGVFRMTAYPERKLYVPATGEVRPISARSRLTFFSTPQ